MWSVGPAFHAVQQAALERLRDGKLLADVVRKCKDAQLRKAALAAIDDESVLADLACSDGPKDLLLEALRGLAIRRSFTHVVSRAKLKVRAKAAAAELPHGAPATSKPEKRDSQAALWCTKRQRQPRRARPQPKPAVDPTVAEREELCMSSKPQRDRRFRGFQRRFFPDCASALGRRLLMTPTNPLHKRFERAASRYIERREVFQSGKPRRHGAQVRWCSRQSARRRRCSIGWRRLKSRGGSQRASRTAAPGNRHVRDEEALKAARRAAQRRGQAAVRAAAEAQRRSKSPSGRARCRACKEGAERKEREKQRGENQDKNLEKLLGVAQKLVELAEKKTLG